MAVDAQYLSLSMNVGIRSFTPLSNVISSWYMFSIFRKTLFIGFIMMAKVRKKGVLSNKLKAMTSYQIQQLIDTANVTQTGVVEWTGDNGLEAILTYINANTVGFGVKTVDSLAQLALLGGNDANLVSVKSVGLYRFNANATQAMPTSVQGVGGIWMLETTYASVSKYQKVFGNGTSTTFDFTHDLNVQYPSITIWDISGISPQLVTSGVDIYSTGVNSVRLEFASAPLLNSYLISVQ